MFLARKENYICAWMTVDCKSTNFLNIFNEHCIPFETYCLFSLRETVWAVKKFATKEKYVFTGVSELWHRKFYTQSSVVIHFESIYFKYWLIGDDITKKSGTAYGIASNRCPKTSSDWKQWMGTKWEDFPGLLRTNFNIEHWKQKSTWSKKRHTFRITISRSTPKSHYASP